eukprot:6635298-Ditylum_brightwellii.AAC.1
MPMITITKLKNGGEKHGGTNWARHQKDKTGKRKTQEKEKNEEEKIASGLKTTIDLKTTKLKAP